MENLKKEIKIGKDLISLDIELARKKKELATLNNQLSIANDDIKFARILVFLKDNISFLIVQSIRIN